MKGHSCYALGTVEEGDNISITNGEDILISSSMNDLRNAWKGTLDGGGEQ